MHRRGSFAGIGVGRGIGSAHSPLFAKVLVTSHSLHLANKQKGVQLHLFGTQSLTPHLITYSALPSPKLLEPRPFRRRWDRGRLKTAHLRRLTVLFPKETRALEEKYQAFHERRT